MKFYKGLIIGGLISVALWVLIILIKLGVTL